VTSKPLRLGSPLSPLDFILKNPVFRLEEFVAAYGKTRKSSAHARDALAYHVKEGRLLNVRRGLYIQAGGFVDPWLIASRLSEEVVISHDGALSFHGVTGLGHRISFMTRSRTSVLRFNEVIYQPIRVRENRILSAEQFKRGGHTILVTSLSSTFVDCLANLERSPPPVELLGLLRNSVGQLDPARMIAHALWYRSPLVVSRLGFFLTCAGCSLDTAEVQLLNGHGVQEPTYFQRSTRTKEDTFIGPWNLIVSPELHGCWLHEAE
jgi:predicted transcriptional regulator of viral defense system